MPQNFGRTPTNSDVLQILPRWEKDKWLQFSFDPSNQRLLAGKDKTHCLVTDMTFNSPYLLDASSDFCSLFDPVNCKSHKPTEKKKEERVYVKDDELLDFQFNLQTRTAICPQGNLATVFNPSSQDNVAFHVRFGKQCRLCPVNSLCTTEIRGRSLELSPHHHLLTKRRQEQLTEAFTDPNITI